MRHLAGRTAGLLSRLAAGESGLGGKGAARAVAGWAQGGAGPCAGPSSSGGSTPAAPSAEPSSSCQAWAWLPRRGLASAAAEPAAAAAEGARAAAGKEGLVISDAAVARLKELGPGTVLRVMVEGGGCSGFQYEFSLDEAAKEDERWAGPGAGAGRGRVGQVRRMLARERSKCRGKRRLAEERSRAW